MRILCLITLLAVASPAAGQELVLQWATAAGGGGRSCGAGACLVATAGQAEALGSSTGGGATIRGGVWGAASGVATSVGESDAPGPPRRLALEKPFPNPFNPTTQLRFFLPRAQSVELSILGLSGRRVRRVFEGELAAGVHDFRWNGEDDSGVRVASGVYLVALSTDVRRLVQRVALIK